MTHSNSLKYIKIFWGIVLGGILLVVLLLLSASYGLLGYMPTFEELENPKSFQATQVISSDHKVLGTYFIQNRSNVRFEEISPYLVNALIATEDARFYEHSGIDVRGLTRAIVKTGLLGQESGGGSTITQQLAKMLFHEKPSSKIARILQKIKEWIIAVKLEKQYSKEEILTMYLNRFDFINNAVGIKSSSHVYFNTTPEKLKIEEAAMLVGMAKNPSLYNPKRRPEISQQRRNVVLYQMSKYGYLTKNEFDSLKQFPVTLHFQNAGHAEGLAPYFREYLRAYLKDWCELHKKPDGTNYNLYKDGLKVYTTIDSRMQQYAEDAMKKHLKEDLQPAFFNHMKGRKNAPFDRSLSQKEIDKLILQAMQRSERYANLKADGMSENDIISNFYKPIEMSVFTWDGYKDTIMSPRDSILYYKYYLRSGLISLDPHTGFVKAYVGGIDYKHFQYDQVLIGKRQVGSLFKPFVYTLAMQEGWSPCRKIPNVPVVFELPEGGSWSPKNSDGKYGGEMTLTYALATSTNCITAYLMKQFGPQSVVNIAKKMGITSDLPPVPSICLGTPDISLYEMTGAFATFANKGVWIKPVFITRIEDENGNVLEEYIPKMEEALSEQTAYLTLELLKGVSQGGGTAVRLRGSRYDGGFSNQIAGKTGTTQNQSDGWFIGIVPDLVTGVWTGCEDRSVHFRSTHLGQGANMALPIWAWYMKSVYKDKSLGITTRPFDPAPADLNVEINCIKYKQSPSAFDETNFD
jgi:penicillin-binding protein 1A